MPISSAQISLGSSSLYHSLFTNVLTGLDDNNTGCISTQVVGGDTDVDSILVHLCDGEGEIATCRVRVQLDVFLPS